MNMETQRIPMKDLRPNTGQVPGLPGNPRRWTKKEVNKLAASLKETPELFDARPIIVYPYEGEYIILGGNLRYEGCKVNGYADAPCYVLPENTTIEKLKEIVIKDNGSFGEWNFDALESDWLNLPLSDWGVPDWESEPEQENKARAKEDDFDENTDAIKVRCKRGDIWQLGEHRLMCGDSIDLQEVKTLMGVTSGPASH